MKTKLPLLIMCFPLFLLTACSNDTESNTTRSIPSTQSVIVSGPENAKEVIRGKVVYKENCQTCHGKKAVGQVANWRESLANGKYPAPPLNGTGHAWHHSESILLRTINTGGIAMGGTMPPFQEVLSEKDKQSVLSYIKSLWPEKTYKMWFQKNGNNQK